MRKHLAVGWIFSLLVIIILSHIVENVLYSGTGSEKMKGVDVTEGERYVFDFLQVEWETVYKNIPSELKFFIGVN